MPDFSFSVLGVDIPNLLPDWHFFRPAGRLIWSSLFLIIGIAIAFVWTRVPKKSAEPSTWAATILGAMAVWYLMTLAYGTVPHEWLNFGNSYLQWTKAEMLLSKGQLAANLPPFDVPKSAVVDGVAGGMYVVFATIQIYLFVAWQKRPVREPAAAGEGEGEGEETAEVPSGPLSRLRRSKRVSAYGRPVTTSE